MGKGGSFGRWPRYLPTLHAAAARHLRPVQPCSQHDTSLTCSVPLPSWLLICTALLLLQINPFLLLNHYPVQLRMSCGQRGGSGGRSRTDVTEGVGEGEKGDDLCK